MFLARARHRDATPAEHNSNKWAAIGRESTASDSRLELWSPKPCRFSNQPGPCRYLRTTFEPLPIKNQKDRRCRNQPDIDALQRNIRKSERRATGGRLVNGHQLDHSQIVKQADRRVDA